MSDYEKVILEVVRDLGDDAYGVPIREAIKRRGAAPFFDSFGSLYKALEDLQAKGLVTSRSSGATAQRGWRPKRYFKLTEAGLQFIN